MVNLHRRSHITQSSRRRQTGIPTLPIGWEVEAPFKLQHCSDRSAKQPKLGQLPKFPRSWTKIPFPVWLLFWGFGQPTSTSQILHVYPAGTHFTVRSTTRQLEPPHGTQTARHHPQVAKVTLCYALTQQQTTTSPATRPRNPQGHVSTTQRCSSGDFEPQPP
jgi:hypothetical protein